MSESKNSKHNESPSRSTEEEEIFNEENHWGLASAVDSIANAGAFAVGGRVVDFVELNMHVEGLGDVTWPLGNSQATDLLRCCDPAPFGRGLDTVVDTSVRRAFQIDASRVKMGTEWDVEIQRLAMVTAQQLGAVSGATRCVRANLYKLVYYKEGGFFKPHKDTEKEPGMFATLAVQLPVEGGHTGGSLLVRHTGEEKTFKWDEDSHMGRFYSAFFTDCEHELLEVKKGHRVCLLYNLVFTGPDQQHPPQQDSSLISMRGMLDGRDKVVDQIREAVVRWETAAAADSSQVDKILIPLEHEYTAANLSFPGLKGRDAAMVARLRAGNCVVHLALVCKHECQMGDEDYRDRYGSGGFCVQETEESMTFDVWVGEDGSKSNASLSVDLETELLAGSVDPFSNREPDDEEFSGFTGNEGATNDLWYRVGFAVVWPRSRAVSMACKAGLGMAVELAQTAVSSGGPEAETTLGEVVNFACSAMRDPRKASKLGPVLGKLLSFTVAMPAVQMCLELLDVLETAASLSHCPWEAWRGIAAAMAAWGDQEDGRVKVAVEGVIRALCKKGQGQGKGVEACVKIVGLLQEEGKLELGVTVARAIATESMGDAGAQGSMASLRCNGGKDYGLLLFRMEGCHAELNAALVAFCARAADLGREVISDLVVSVYEELGAPALGAEGGKREGMVSLVSTYTSVMFLATRTSPPTSPWRSASSPPPPPDWGHASKLLSLLLLHNERLLLDLFVAAFVGDRASRTAAAHSSCLKHLLAHPPVKAACQAGDVAVVRLAESLMAHLRRPKPEFSWCRPKVKLRGYPAVGAFLRGPEMTFVYQGCFTGIADARGCASLVNGVGSVSCVASGIGRNAQVSITKAKEYYEQAVRAWQADQRWLKTLRVWLGVPDNHHGGVGAVAAAAEASNVGGALRESNGVVNPPPSKKPRVVIEILD